MELATPRLDMLCERDAGSDGGAKELHKASSRLRKMMIIMVMVP
jgi:hypothetical protein